MESTIYTVAGKDFELQHYGVKGMRWGHRKKYYNSDGSLNARGEKKHAKEVERQRVRAEKKQFKADVKDFRKHGFDIDYKIDAKTGQFSVTEYRNSKQQKLGTEYAERVIAQHQKQNARACMATTAGLLGTMVVAAMLSASRG